MVVKLLALPLQVCAQHAKRPVPLEIPEGEVLRCIRPDSAQAASLRGMQLREFRVGSPETESTRDGLQRGRKITIAADSLGRPLLLVEETSRDWLGAVIIIRVISTDSAKSIRQDVAIDSLALARAMAAIDISCVDSAMRMLPQRM